MAKSQAQMIREILQKYRRLYPTRYDPSVITRQNRHGWRCWIDYDNGQIDHYISEMDSRWDALDETLRTLRQDVHFDTPRHGGVDDLANQFGRWRF